VANAAYFPGFCERLVSGNRGSYLKYSFCNLNTTGGMWDRLVDAYDLPYHFSGWNHNPGPTTYNPKTKSYIYANGIEYDRFFIINPRISRLTFCLWEILFFRCWIWDTTSNKVNFFPQQTQSFYFEGLAADEDDGGLWALALNRSSPAQQRFLLKLNSTGGVQKIVAEYNETNNCSQ
jgi:hypothetical protein